MSDHTKEPWIARGPCVFFSANAGGFSLSDCPDSHGNASRIVACVNACSGIPDEKLERIAHVLGHRVEFLSGLLYQRDELLSLVKGFHRKLETYRNVYTGDKELRRLLDECEAAIAKAEGTDRYEIPDFLRRQA